MYAQYGVTIAHSLVSLNRKRVPVRLVNPYNKTVVFSKGDIVATLTDISDIAVMIPLIPLGKT